MKISISKAPRDIDRQKTYYHGTSSRGIDSIIKNGLVPQVIEKPRRQLAPMIGRVYITPNISYALMYAIGGNMLGNKLPDHMMVDRYCYLCILEGSQLKDILPDEDSIGEMVCNKNFVWLNHLAQYSVVPNTYRRVMDGEYAYWAKLGKILLKKLTEDQINQIIDRGAHLAHGGILEPAAIYKFDKTLCESLHKDGSNFFDLATKL